MKYWLIGGIMGLIFGGTLFALNCWDLVFGACASNSSMPSVIGPSCGNPFACINQAFFITLFAIIGGLIIGFVIDKKRK